MNLDALSNEEKIDLLFTLSENLFVKVDGENYPASICRRYGCDRSLAVYIGGHESNYECLGCTDSFKKRLTIRR